MKILIKIREHVTEYQNAISVGLFCIWAIFSAYVWQMGISIWIKIAVFLGSKFLMDYVFDCVLLGIEWRNLSMSKTVMRKVINKIKNVRP